MKKRKDQDGVALVVVMLMLVVGTLIAVWSMSTTQYSITMIGSYRSKTDLSYRSEQALKTALIRVTQIIQTPDGETINLSDRIGTTARTISFLVDDGNLCQNGSCGNPNPECADNAKMDTVVQNVICNFLGNSIESTTVNLVRQDDYVDTNQTSAVFLINVISEGQQGRRAIKQGVIIAPYDNRYGTFVSTRTPYLATASASVESG